MCLSVERKYIYIKGGIARLIAANNSLYDTKPLQNLITSVITPKILVRVAGEYDKGQAIMCLKGEFSCPYQVPVSKYCQLGLENSVVSIQFLLKIQFVYCFV